MTPAASDTAEMPRYLSHKTVWALKIRDILQSPVDKQIDGGSYEIIPENASYGPITVTAAYIAKHSPQAGGYYVVYADGYHSYCPGPQFEEGNTLVGNEEAAIDRLKNSGSPSHHHAKGTDLRSFPQSDIDNWFSYHAPTAEQIVQYGEIRTAAKIFAETINRHVPGGADKTAAMRDLRGCVMAANLAIACYTRPTVKSLEEILKADDQPAIEVHTDGSITAG